MRGVSDLMKGWNCLNKADPVLVKQHGLKVGHLAATQKSLVSCHAAVLCCLGNLSFLRASFIFLKICNDLSCMTMSVTA